MRYRMMMMLRRAVGVTAAILTGSTGRVNVRGRSRAPARVAESSFAGGWGIGRVARAVHNVVPKGVCERWMNVVFLGMNGNVSGQPCDFENTS